MTTRKKSRTVQSPIRVARTIMFPAEMYDQLVQAAKLNSRSVNGEVIHRLSSRSMNNGTKE